MKEENIFQIKLTLYIRLLQLTKRFIYKYHSLRRRRYSEIFRHEYAIFSLKRATVDKMIL
jgi:hypothetical protein